MLCGRNLVGQYREDRTSARDLSADSDRVTAEIEHLCLNLTNVYFFFEVQGPTHFAAGACPHPSLTVHFLGCSDASAFSMLAGNQHTVINGRQI